MLLAAIVIGTLLGSASVAQARSCYCSDDDSLHGHRTACQYYWFSREKGLIDCGGRKPYCYISKHTKGGAVKYIKFGCGAGETGTNCKLIDGTKECTKICDTDICNTDVWEK